jgi:hypothetical protein
MRFDSSCIGSTYSGTNIIPHSTNYFPQTVHFSHLRYQKVYTLKSRKSSIISKIPQFESTNPVLLLLRWMYLLLLMLIYGLDSTLSCLSSSCVFLIYFKTGSVHYLSGGSMKLNARIMHLAYMVYL